MNRVLELLVVAYGFFAGWIAYRFYHGFGNGIPHGLALQALQGDFESAFNLLLPEIILTPAIVLLALQRTAIFWTPCVLTLSLLALLGGAEMGSTAPRYFTPTWDVVIGFLFNVVPLAVWSTLITVAIRVWKPHA